MVGLSTRWLAGGLAAVASGIAARLWLWSHPVEQLLAWTLADDGFYYFVIGRNIARGLGSTFDGINPTNGYHPLWMGFSTLCFSLLREEMTAVRSLLLLGWLFDLSAGFVLTYLASVIVRDKRYAALVGVLWLANHRIIGAMQNGMETGLSALAMSLAILAAFKLLQHASQARALAFGVSAGLAILARTDTALLIGLLLVAVAFHHRKPSLLVTCTALVLLTTSPWLLWNYCQFGTILQSSATAITELIRAQLEVQLGAQLTWSRMLPILAGLWLDTFKRVYILAPLPVGRWAWISVLWVGLAIVLVGRQYATPVAGHRSSAALAHQGEVQRWTPKRSAYEARPSTPPRRRGVSRLAFWWEAAPAATRWLLSVLAIWPALFVTVHVGWRWYFRPHYYLSLAPSIVLIFALIVWGLLRGGGLCQAWALLLLPLALFAAVQYAGGALLHHQASTLEAARYLNRAGGDCSVVGSFNAGILGFYYRRGRVVDLDGVVNNAAARASRSRALGGYAKQEGVCLLADAEAGPRELLQRAVWGDSRPGEASLLLTIPQSGQAGDYAVYRVQWSGSE